MATVMPRKMFVNLPVHDLKRSVEFFQKLGFTFDPRFTDAQASCMIISDEAFVMLLQEDRFKDFARKPIVDATRRTEGIFSLSTRSRMEVDELVTTAMGAGAKPAAEKIEQDGMYGRSFYDLDGHHWEVVYLEPPALRIPPEVEAEADAWA